MSELAYRIWHRWLCPVCLPHVRFLYTHKGASLGHAVLLFLGIMLVAMLLGTLAGLFAY